MSKKWLLVIKKHPPRKTVFLFVIFWTCFLTFLDRFCHFSCHFLRGGGSKPRNTFYILRGFSGGSLELRYRVFFDPFLTFFRLLVTFCHFLDLFFEFLVTFCWHFLSFLCFWCHFLVCFSYKSSLQEVVGSARSQLFIPGFRHAHTLQQPKSNMECLFDATYLITILGGCCHSVVK